MPPLRKLGPGWRYILDADRNPLPVPDADAAAWYAATRRFPELYVVNRTAVGFVVVRTEFARVAPAVVGYAQSWPFHTWIENADVGDDGRWESRRMGRLIESLPDDVSHCPDAESWADSLTQHDTLVRAVWALLPRWRRWWHVRPRDVPELPEIEPEAGAEAPTVISHPNTKPLPVWGATIVQRHRYRPERPGWLES
jgi:hypothetical protein